MASNIRYCPMCQKNVSTDTQINWIIFILLLILGVILGVIYLIYCLCSSSHRKCGICGCTTLQPPKPEKIASEPVSESTSDSKQS